MHADSGTRARPAAEVVSEAVRTFHRPRREGTFVSYRLENDHIAQLLVHAGADLEDSAR